MTKNSGLNTFERLQSSALRMNKNTTASARSNYLGSTLNPNIVKSQSSLFDSANKNYLGVHQSHRKTTTKLMNPGAASYMNTKIVYPKPMSGHTKSQSELMKLKATGVGRKTTLIGNGKTMGNKTQIGLTNSQHQKVGSAIIANTTGSAMSGSVQIGNNGQSLNGQSHTGQSHNGLSHNG